MGSRLALVLSAGVLVGYIAQAGAAGSVAGKTIKYTNSRGQTYWTTYNKDGTSFSKSTRTDGAGSIHELGHWRYVHGVLCERYNNWQNGKEFCR